MDVRTPTLGLCLGVVLVVVPVLLLAGASGMLAKGSPIFEDSFRDTSLIESMHGVVVANGQVSLAGSGGPVDPVHDPALTLSLAETGFPQLIGAPAVLRVGGAWYLFFHLTPDNFGYAIYVATSSDGLSWTPVSTPAVSPSGSAYRAAYPGVLYQGGLFQMWYGSYDGVAYTIYRATSPDGITWTSGTQVLGTDYDGGIDYWSADPSVLWDGTQYTMWYWSTYPGAAASIRYATSTDGLNWNRLGTVVSPKTLDGIGMTTVGSPSVVREGSELVMWYGCGTPGTGYICRARSLDGVAWDQEGVALSPNPSDPSQDILVGLPSAVRLDDGRYRVYYEARGSRPPTGAYPGDEIWSGTTTSSALGRGSVTSVAIPAGPGGKYRAFEASWNLPAGTSITIDILDSSGNPIPGFAGLTSKEFSLAEVSGKTYPSIHLRASLVGTSSDSPALYAWEVF